MELKDRINGRRVVASISGGKDSAAMSLYLAELGIDHDRVFLDTGWEHDLTYEYLRGPLTAKLGPIVELRAPLLMEGLIRKKGMFPSRVRRFCTQDHAAPRARERGSRSRRGASSSQGDHSSEQANMVSEPYQPCE
jgi:3'-phosphoadenosine 5'-phosphosulfate sulfotransferase (PAPS reductase)/FAD synthetase